MAHVALALCLGASSAAEAHVAASAGEPPSLAAAWTLDPWLLVPLIAAASLYAIGLLRLWGSAGAGRGVRYWEAAAHGGGLATLFFALVWPLDALGEWSMAAHMAQHMLLLAVAAPLLLLGRPGLVWLAALPRGLGRRLARGAHASFRWRSSAVLMAPTAAALLQAAVMWGWHLPAAMNLALSSDPVHYAMHASFLGAGLLFWGALLTSLRETRVGFGAGAVALLGTMAQMGLLSALLTFAPTPRFDHYVGRAEWLGLSALEDQQLAGLIMWVPSALPYLIGAVLLTAAWLGRAEWQDSRRARARRSNAAAEQDAVAGDDGTHGRR